MTGEYENFGVPFGRNLLAERDALRQENAALKAAILAYDAWAAGGCSPKDAEGQMVHEGLRAAARVIIGQEK